MAYATQINLRTPRRTLFKETKIIIIITTHRRNTYQKKKKIPTHRRNRRVLAKNPPLGKAH